MEKRKTTQCTERGQHKRCAHLCQGEAPCWRNYVCDPAKNKDCTGIPGGRCMIQCYNTLDKDKALIPKSCCKYGPARRIAGYCFSFTSKPCNGAALCHALHPARCVWH